MKPNHLILSSIGNMHPAALDYLHYSESHAVLSSTPPVPGLLTQAARRADGEPRVRAAVSRRRRCTRRQGQRRGQRRARGLESSRGRARLRVVRVRREGLRRGNGCMCMCMCMSMCMCVHALLPPACKLPDLPSPLPPPRTSWICRVRSDLCHSSLLGVANLPGVRGSYGEETDPAGLWVCD